MQTQSSTNSPEQPPDALKRCIGLVPDSTGVVLACLELVRRDRRRTHHSKQCQLDTHRLRGRGLEVGDRWLHPCKGWLVRDKVVSVCGVPTARQKYHSEECWRATENLRRRGLKPGDPGKRKTKILHPHSCEGWVIRDGHVAVCGVLTRRYFYHTRKCGDQKAYWSEKLGLALGNSVRRRCSYRFCTSPPFDRIKPSKEYWCPQKRASHMELERRYRKADKLAAQMRELQEQLEVAKAQLELKNEGQPAFIRSKVEQAISVMKTLNALPEIQAKPYLALDDRWTPAGFSKDQICAFGRALLDKARPSSLPKVAAMHLVEIQEKLSFETVRKYCNSR